LPGRTSAPVILVRTKADVCLATDDELETERRAVGASAALSVSAESGAGLGALVSTTADAVARDTMSLEVDAPLLTHARQQYGVSRALDEVREFSARWRSGDVPAVVAAVHLREAVRSLEELV